MADDVAAFLRERLKDDAVDAAAIAITGHAAKSQRAFRETVAKRAILAEHAYDKAACRVCWEVTDTSSMRARFPCPTIRALAAVYSDHPDYRQEWVPHG